jgi:hypothetical protein
MPVAPSAGGPGRVHELHLVTGSWSETALTWDNAPSVSSTVTASITVPSGPQCLTFDVTGDVQGWVDGAANHGWSLRVQTESGNHWVQYATREHGTASERPALDISYDVS